VRALLYQNIDLDSGVNEKKRFIREKNSIDDESFLPKPSEIFSTGCAHADQVDTREEKKSIHII
jgi:hypothetical protein